MSLQPQQSLSLRDALGRDLGQVVVEQIKDDLVFGRFSPGPACAEVAHMFANQVEAANEQLLSIVAEWDAAIAALSLALSSTDSASLPAIHDVQIGAGVITFRIRKPAPDTRKTAGKQHFAVEQNATRHPTPKGLAALSRGSRSAEAPHGLAMRPRTR